MVFEKTFFKNITLKIFFYKRSPIAEIPFADFKLFF
jgi:hypothetical protein